MKNNSKSIQNILNNEKIDIFTKKISDCNELEVKVGTNGYHGGDGGHGSATYISIKDAGNTSMEIQTLKDSDKNNIGFEIHLAGDAELRTIIESFKFILNTLEEQSKKHVK